MWRILSTPSHHATSPPTQRYKTRMDNNKNKNEMNDKKKTTTLCNGKPAAAAGTRDMSWWRVSSARYVFFSFFIFLKLYLNFYLDYEQKQRTTVHQQQQQGGSRHLTSRAPGMFSFFFVSTNTSLGVRWTTTTNELRRTHARTNEWWWTSSRGPQDIQSHTRIESYVFFFFVLFELFYSTKIF